MNRVSIPIAALSLGISILLWMVVFSQGAKPAITRDYMVQLTPDAIKDARWATTKIPDTVRVTVSASETRIARLNPETFRAFVDLSKASAGTRNYPVQVFPAALREVLAGTSLSVPVDIEPVMQKRVGVAIETKGELADPELTLQSMVTEPMRALVTGPQSAVEAVRQVKGFLDLSDVSFGPGSSADVELEALDRNGRVLDRVRTEPLFARVRLGVATTPQEKQVLIVPNFRGAPAAGYVPASYTLTPTQLAVRGRSSVLAAFSKVSTDPIDLTGLTADKTFEVPVRLPAGARAVGPSTVKVAVKIRPVAAPTPPAPVDDGPIR